MTKASSQASAQASYPDWVEKELTRVQEVSKRSIHRDVQKPRYAIAARYDSARARIVVELDNGADFSFPPQLAQGLGNAPGDALAAIELSPLGTGLHWTELNVDLTVDGLLVGVFGSRNWMRKHAAIAGAVSSPAKTAAARANGAKGGRPRSQLSSAV
jgi:Protein of unknown function (DUF2442)